MMVDANRNIVPGLLRIVFSLLVITAASGCSHYSREIERLPSPGHRVEAILVERQKGFSGAVYLVYIAPLGAHRLGDEVFLADSCQGLKIEWKNDKILDISYSKAIVYSYRNYWYSSDVDDWRYRVEVRLRPTTEFSLNVPEL
jgi:hypothetical protein